MVIVEVESSLESSTCGGGGGVGSNSGDEGNYYEGSSASIGYTSDSDDTCPPEDLLPSREVPETTVLQATGGSGNGSKTPLAVLDGDRIFHGVPLFLQQGGVEIDPVPLVSVGGLPSVSGYDWVDFEVNTQVSALTRSSLQYFVDRSHIMRDSSDA